MLVNCSNAGLENWSPGEHDRGRGLSARSFINASLLDPWQQLFILIFGRSLLSSDIVFFLTMGPETPLLFAGPPRGSLPSLAVLDGKAMPGGKDKNPVGTHLSPSAGPVFDYGGLALREEWGRSLPCHGARKGPS